jgi:hypothetical protein
MRGLRSGLVAAVVAVALAATARLSLHAQDPKGADGPALVLKKDANGAEPSCSVQDALVKPFHLPFGDPTRLDEVCRYLRRTLNAPVVLDLAALGRQNVRPEETVQLELQGVRLKTGLKLLLDQVGLTYRVVAEDNLLILTDHQAADDPMKRVQSEVHELHRDLHNVQDTLDDVRSVLGIGDEGAKVRKPTIIEEMPQESIEEEAEPQPSPRPRRGI